MSSDLDFAAQRWITEVNLVTQKIDLRSSLEMRSCIKMISSIAAIEVLSYQDSRTLSLWFTFDMPLVIAWWTIKHSEQTPTLAAPPDLATPMRSSLSVRIWPLIVTILYQRLFTLSFTLTLSIQSLIIFLVFVKKVRLWQGPSICLVCSRYFWL
jgi:hypothetical protein